MKQYTVISPYRIRDKDGKTTDKQANKGDTVLLHEDEARRLIAAKCVVDVETMTKRAAENRAGPKVMATPVDDVEAQPEQPAEVKRKRGRPKKNDIDTGNRIDGGAG